VSDEERKLADTTGRFAQVVKNGRELTDAAWIGGRVLLSNKRLVLASNDGKRTIPIQKITDIGGRYDANQRIAEVSGYIGVTVEDDVLVVAPEDPDTFELELYRGVLGSQQVLARHPAVEGGVVQDTDWETARLQLEEDSVNVAIADGTFVPIELDDVGAVEMEDRTVEDETRPVVEVEHSEDETSVETYIASSPRKSVILRSLLAGAEEENSAEVELSDTEKQVLMALYSGVSPFEIPEFTGIDVDEVEAMFEDLIEREILDEVRKRREVTLTARGRNMASESINQ
jgi:helix-turn-helix protein